MTNRIGGAARSRRALAILGAVAVLTALVLAARSLSAENTPIAAPSAANSAPVTPSDDPSASPSTALTPSSAPQDEPTPTERTDSPIEVKETVPIDDVADFGDGITVEVARVTPVQADGGGGIGDLAGPAIAVALRLTNDRSTTISLGEVVVTATYGTDDVPAPGVFHDTRNDHFSGSLRAGRSATGTYVFSLPEDARDRVTILVSYAGGVPNVAFQGSLT